MAVATAQPVQTPTDPDIALAWHRVRADSALQFDLPAFQPPEAPAWLRWLIAHLSWLGGAGAGLFWVAVAVAAVAVIALLVRLALHLRRPASRPEDAQKTPWQPKAQAARALLAEADAMAATGDYGAAARLLLHRSLEDVERYCPALVRPSATTREIGGAGAFPAAARSAFLPIAAAVERSLFGGRVLARADWETARESYRRFALPDVWA